MEAYRAGREDQNTNKNFFVQGQVKEDAKDNKRKEQNDLRE